MSHDFSQIYMQKQQGNSEILCCSECYLVRVWCPQSRRGCLSGYCSHWNIAKSPYCSSAAPYSSLWLEPWLEYWLLEIGSPHAEAHKVIQAGRRCIKISTYLHMVFNTLRFPLHTNVYTDICIFLPSTPYLGCNASWANSCSVWIICLHTRIPLWTRWSLQFSHLIYRPPPTLQSAGQSWLTGTQFGPVLRQKM